MEVGDVSLHHGWLLHCTAPQPPSSPPRMALAVCLFADGARVLPRGGKGAGARSLKQGMAHDEDAEGYSSWLRELKPGARAVHAALPLVWPPPPSPKA